MVVVSLVVASENVVRRGNGREENLSFSRAEIRRNLSGVGLEHHHRDALGFGRFGVDARVTTNRRNVASR